MIGPFNNLFNWKPDSEEFVAPLLAKVPFKSLLGLLPKGIDNAHIDVMLSSEFTNRTRLLVRRILLHDLTVNYWGEPPSPPDSSDLQAVRNGYTGMMELAVDKAREGTNLELIQLLQFAVIKFILRVVDEEFERYRNQLKRAKGTDGYQSSGRSVQLHDRLVVLAKEEQAIRYRLNRRLFRELFKLESLHLSKLRKSVLGRSWPVPKLLMFNPMLQLPSLTADELVMSHYSLVCTDKDDPSGFGRVNRLVLELFEDYLPNWSLPLPADAVQGVLSDTSTLFIRDYSEYHVPAVFHDLERLLVYSLQPDEYREGRPTWLDVPENIDRIIYSAETEKLLGDDPQGQHVVSYWQNREWPHFHDRLLKRAIRLFHGSHLDRQVLACHAAPGIYRELNRVVPVRLICYYLAGTLKRSDLMRKLSGMQMVQKPAQVIKVLDQTLLAIKTMPAVRQRKRLFSFLRHFTIFRRDLKMAYQSYQAMSRIRLLTQPKDLELSRSNGTLHEFLLRKELKPDQHRIRNHVILKADVRGSTKMTQQLLAHKLNPASHFSLNFFEPINSLLESYGAKKVFIEGDAVILSIFEYEDTPYQWLCVSHACGLARKILQVVDTQNSSNRENGLPELELGLGIAFSNEKPTFLYDESHEIMISSAINRADRLSSCSAALRRSMFGRSLGRGVEVMAPKNTLGMDKESPDQLIRYNVNGIELEPAAFKKLKSELALRIVKPQEISLQVNGHFLVGRYPDLEGKMHWLVVREAPVRYWDGGEPGIQDLDGRMFYQVVTDTEVASKLTAHYSQRRSDSAETPPLKPSEPPPTETNYLH